MLLYETSLGEEAANQRFQLEQQALRRTLMYQQKKAEEEFQRQKRKIEKSEEMKNMKQVVRGMRTDLNRRAHELAKARARILQLEQEVDRSVEVKHQLEAQLKHEHFQRISAQLMVTQMEKRSKERRSEGYRKDDACELLTTSALVYQNPQGSDFQGETELSTTSALLYDSTNAPKVFPHSRRNGPQRYV